MSKQKIHVKILPWYPLQVNFVSHFVRGQFKAEGLEESVVDTSLVICAFWVNDEVVLPLNDLILIYMRMSMKDAKGLTQLSLLTMHSQMALMMNLHLNGGFLTRWRSVIVSLPRWRPSIGRPHINMAWDCQRAWKRLSGLMPRQGPLSGAMLLRKRCPRLKSLTKRWRVSNPRTYKLEWSLN